jgi:hypothetical protein
MRILFPIAICAIACQAQRPEDGVIAVYRQMEKFEQTGNGQAWVELWSAKSNMSEHAVEMKAMIQPRPSVRYGVTKILVEGERAALVGTMDRQFLSQRFVRENGAWKILDQEWSDSAIDPASLYVLLPPADGAFSRAGSPWENIARSVVNAKYYKPEEVRWKLQATFDESFLYVRFESPSVLPVPNTQVYGTFPNLKSGAETGWPVMRIRTPREYTFHVSDAVGDQSTFDEQGKANSHRYFVLYSVSLRRGDSTVFSAGAGTRPDPLISVQGRFLEVRFPLKTLGMNGPGATIEIADANIPIGQFVTYQVKGFGR